jgi:hypothetical protein
MASGDECPPQGRLDFLGEHIFDFTTYESGMSELFASKAVEVCAAINDGKTFDYIKDADNYRWYLLMVNMPFFQGRLDGGTSIRGAWWAHNMPPVESCGLYEGGEQVLSLSMDDPREWQGFIRAVIEFAGASPSP